MWTIYTIYKVQWKRGEVPPGVPAQMEVCPVCDRTLDQVLERVGGRRVLNQAAAAAAPPRGAYAVADPPAGAARVQPQQQPVGNRGGPAGPPPVPVQQFPNNYGAAPQWNQPPPAQNYGTWLSPSPLPSASGSAHPALALTVEETTSSKQLLQATFNQIHDHRRALQQPTSIQPTSAGVAVRNRTQVWDSQCETASLNRAMTSASLPVRPTENEFLLFP